LILHIDCETDTAQTPLGELGLRLDIQKYFAQVIEKLEAGGTISSNDFWTQINKLAREKYGCEYGIPMPSDHDPLRPLITAKGTPLHLTMAANSLSDYRFQLHRQGYRVRNSWTKLGDEEQFVLSVPRRIEYADGEDTGDCSHHYEIKSMAFWKPLAGSRLRKLIDTILMRGGSAQTVEAEFAAMEKLKSMINDNQWKSYVLSGAFGERSRRSDLQYIFRKGYPTIVLSYHGDFAEGYAICCLCLHPFGYYQGTYCGMMCPTDEVISHLLLMRGDEHDYWRQCGQWPARDPRSGL
jgi:hypothetical protein